MTHHTNVRSSAVKPNAVLLVAVMMVFFLLAFVVDLFPRPATVNILAGQTAALTATHTDGAQTPQP